MAVMKTTAIGKTGLMAPDAHHSIEYLGANDAEVSGKFRSYVSEAAAGDGSDALDRQPVVRILAADQSAAVKAALVTIRDALEAAAVADAGVTEVKRVDAVKPVAAVEADPENGIEAVAAVAAVEAVKAVSGRAPGQLFGGTLV